MSEDLTHSKYFSFNAAVDDDDVMDVRRDVVI